ncbi:glycoside hydrolase family protein [Micromonospora viridifaciens]|uniref:hypothetical protein n=1 Tax=Micromonospora viridifaciens TaxID=1881 RepID=UPI0012FD6692|nr:hypothetical protein [Micromonospora viridifaciens]
MSSVESYFSPASAERAGVSDPDLARGPTASAADLFNGTATLAQPTRSPFPGTIGGHAESTSIIWNGQYLMYYRTFISPSGATCSIPQGVALATSSDSGATWTPVNGGRPLPALQTVQPGQSCAFDDSVDSTWVYSPDVIADGSRLVMVFEQRDHDPNYAGPGQGRSLHTIRYVTSTDGRNWSNRTLLLSPGPVGAWDDEIGTPDIEKDGSGYLLTFHGHDATGRLSQTRGLVRLDALNGEYTGVRQKINLSPTPDWANYGIGKSNMTRGSDGYWYIIFEAFSGASGECGRTDTRTVVGIARSTDAVTWSPAPAPLINGRDGLSCGYDMPSWQILGDVRGIVTPNDPPEGGSLVRWDIVGKGPRG